MRRALTTALQLMGMASVTAGAAAVNLAAGLIVGGLCAFGVGYLIGDQ
jgi:hypothetical protein